MKRSGTKFAAAMVLGAAACVLCARPALARAQDGTSCEVTASKILDARERTVATLKCSRPTTAAQQSAAQADGQTPGALPPANPAKRFPFPGEDPSAAEQPVAPLPQSTEPPDTPGTAEPQRKPKTPPPAYPGDPDAGKAADPEDGFSSSSSSSSGADSGAGPMTDAGSSGDTTDAVPYRRKKLKKVDPQTPRDREAEDLDVADFYMKAGNFSAAYARAKDAVTLQADDPFAQFALAESARKLGKADEAREHYAQCLKLDPAPKEMKAAQRGLAELTASR